MTTELLGAISHAKLQSHHHHQQTNIPFFTGQMPSCRPTNSVKALKGKNITFHGLAYPKLTWGLPTLSLTNSSSWLPCGRVAMPRISPLMPVPHEISEITQLLHINRVPSASCRLCCGISCKLTSSRKCTLQSYNQSIYHRRHMVI